MDEKGKEKGRKAEEEIEERKGRGGKEEQRGFNLAQGPARDKKTGSDQRIPKRNKLIAQQIISDN